MRLKKKKAKFKGVCVCSAMAVCKREGKQKTEESKSRRGLAKGLIIDVFRYCEGHG